MGVTGCGAAGHGTDRGDAMPSKFRACAIAALLLCSTTAAAAAAPPLQDFLRHAQFLDVEISPTGEYLAASVMASEDTGALVILRRSDLKMTGSFKLRGRTLVDYFEWANDERIVFSVQEKQGSLDNPSGTGEVYATNWDGSRQELLLGPRARSSTESAPAQGSPRGGGSGRHAAWRRQEHPGAGLSGRQRGGHLSQARATEHLHWAVVRCWRAPRC